MAPTKRKTKHKPEKSHVGEEVLDLVISYIHDVEDRNSVSLVSRKFYEIDGITRKHVTVHTLYYPNPASFSKRFPFIESLTLKGPCGFNKRYHHIEITPWIEQLALEFRCLKELHIRRLVVHDEDLETLASTRGKDLRSLKIKTCKGFSTDGLMHVSKYCNRLRTLCLRYSYPDNVKDKTWLHQLALNSTVLEKLHVTCMGICNEEDLTLIAKTCCNSLISLKIGECRISKLGDVFRHAVRLEHFSGDNRDQKNELVGFEFPRNLLSLSIAGFTVIRYSIILPFLNQIRKLELRHFSMGLICRCSLFKSFPNLEVLYTARGCGSDGGLPVIAKFCKKLCKLTHNGLVTDAGVIALAKGCTKLECLKVEFLLDISNETIKCLGTHMKNLRKFRMHLDKKDGTTDLPIDNGILAMLMGCRKLKRLDIILSPGCMHVGLTDVGLEYIGKYGANLRSLALECVGSSNTGLLKLSQGCPKLRKLKMRGCPFSKQVVTSCVFNMPSLRYVWFDSSDRDSTVFVFTRPEFQT